MVRIPEDSEIQQEVEVLSASWEKEVANILDCQTGNTWEPMGK